MLQAVPENEECEPVRESAQQEKLTKSAPESNPTTITSQGLHSSSSISEGTLAPTSCPVSEIKSAFNIIPTKGAIGSYKHGKISWRQADSNPPETKPTATTESRSKPKIQVVIPQVSRDRPLPVLPFFGIKPRSASNEMKKANQSSKILHSRSKSSEPYKLALDSGNASSDSQEDDCSSANSSVSSQTSAEEEYALDLAKRALDLSSPGKPSPTDLLFPAGDSTQYGIPPSMAPPRRYEHLSCGVQDVHFKPACEQEYERPAPLDRKPILTQKSSRREREKSIPPTMDPLYAAITKSLISPTLSEAENDLQEELNLRSLNTPGGQSEILSAQSEEYSFVWDNVMLLRERMEYEASAPRSGIPREDSCIIEFDSAPPPSVPRRSSKRASTATKNKFRLSQLPTEISPYATRSLSQRRQKRLTIEIPDYAKPAVASSPSPVTQTSASYKGTITPGSAEAVILNLFRSLDHLDDLFALAVLNRGFYRVFKRYELDLIKSTLRKMSPAAWEFREVAFPGHDMLIAEDLEMTRPEEEYTPTAYLQLQKQDIQTIRAIKSQILVSCQSFVRPEISVALQSEIPSESARVDNALWRIWTFCKIFGSGKDREDDIVAQIDWLKGGPVAHQKVSFSILSTDYMNDTLVGASESFARGNEDGLSAEQLFDMMELWNCMSVLLQGFEGRTSQAREAGIFDNTDIRGGDIDGEELMLGMYSTCFGTAWLLILIDEWCYYLLTLGPATVLDIASSYRQPHCSPFQLALDKGWANWSPPVSGSTRRNFLKEAASRVYEDQIVSTYAASSTRHVQRQQSKVRIQQHITELRKRKNSGERMPMIRQSQERPMSEWDTVITNLTKPPPLPTNNLVSYIPTLRSTIVQQVSNSIPELPVTQTPPPVEAPASPPRRIVAQPLLPSPPPSTVPSVRDRSSLAMSMSSVERHFGNRNDEDIPQVPSLVNHPAFRDGAMVCPPPPQDHPIYTQPPNNPAQAFQQHQTQQQIFGSHTYENTADKAIYRVVEMGFTAEQAREALRVTDSGDGLRVDRAVELLLSGRIPRRS